MMNEPIYIDLPPEILQSLPAPLEQLARRQGVEIPTGVRVTEAAMPPAADGLVSKDWGLLITLATPENLAAAVAALSGMILVLSQFLQAPKVRWEIEELEITKPDGTVIRRRKKTPILLEPGPRLKAQLLAQAEQGRGFVVKANLEH
jgi:hypothetical protein